MSPIVFNGKSYSSVDEMPPDIRQAYDQDIAIFADKNENGIPDVFEEATGKEGMSVQSVSISSNKTQLLVEGNVYSNIEEMPDDVRQKYEQAMAKMVQVLRDANQNNVPDILEDILPSQATAPAEQVKPEVANTTRRSILGSASPVVEDATPKFWSSLLIGIVIVVLTVVIGGFAILVLLR